jgi:hypothetical protein
MAQIEPFRLMTDAEAKSYQNGYNAGRYPVANEPEGRAGAAWTAGYRWGQMERLEKLEKLASAVAEGVELEKLRELLP